MSPEPEGREAEAPLWLIVLLWLICEPINLVLDGWWHVRYYLGLLPFQRHPGGNHE